MALRYEAVKSIVRQPNGWGLLIQSKALASQALKPYLILMSLRAKKSCHAKERNYHDDRHKSHHG